MTTVRIAHVGERPGRGGRVGSLVVLADDAGHRAVPVWLWGVRNGVYHLSDLLDLAGRPADQAGIAGVPQELTTRLLGAARARVTGVDIDVTEPGAAELSHEVTVARIGLAGPSGTRQVTADLDLGLALAAATGAPVRLADAVLDRLAVPVPGDDPLTPFLDRVPPWPALPGHGLRPLARPPRRRLRFEPRNLDFADGLDRWDLDTWPDQPGADQQGAADGEPDYVAAAEGPSAVLSSVVPRPAAPAALVQAIYADDYRGATVTFSGEVQVDPVVGQAGLRLEILPYERHRTGEAREDHSLTIRGRRRDHPWTRYELTVRIPQDAELIRFGVGLAGSGRIALRNPGLRIAEPGAGAP